jgi:integrase/recombinase XerD
MVRASISPRASATPSFAPLALEPHDRLARRCMLSWCRATGRPLRLAQGLRHGFGVAAVSAGIPLNLVQKWLGHAQLTTTAIYADAVGEEEQSIAARMW